VIVVMYSAIELYELSLDSQCSLDIVKGKRVPIFEAELKGEGDVTLWDPEASLLFHGSRPLLNSQTVCRQIRYRPGRNSKTRTLNCRLPVLQYAT
jgi:hypothetical protein